LRDALQIIGSRESKVLSVIDIKHAFYYLKIAPESQKYLTIAPYPGARTYQYVRLAQGLNLSPTLFHDKIATILDEIPEFRTFGLHIADDIILFSQNIEEHEKHLELLLTKLIEYGLKVSLEKAALFRKEVKYMGHIIITDDEGVKIQAEKSKIEAIEWIKIPTTVKELKSFIGMVTYLSIYLKDLQLLLKPLH
jgi:hypothetical protein